MVPARCKLIYVWIFCSIGLFVFAEGAGWSEVVNYTYSVYKAEPADFSRANPPYGRHVWILPALQNRSSQLVSAVELRIRFLDAFGDVLYSSDPVKLQFDLEPGQQGFATQTLFFEDNPFTMDVYDLLWGPAQSEALQTEVAVLRIAFGDGTVESYPEVWVTDEFSRLDVPSPPVPTEHNYDPPKYSFSESAAPFTSGPIEIMTRSWLVAWLSFEGSGEITLQVLKEGRLVAEGTYAVADMDGALFVEDGPGVFEIRVTGAAFDRLVVQEASE